jgi:membrane protein
VRLEWRRGWADSPWGFVRRVFTGAFEDNITFLASALTFDLLLAALPFVLLLLSVLGFILHAGGDAGGDVQHMLDQMLPGGEGADRLQQVETFVTDIVASRTQLSAFGIPLFLWFATRLFTAARAALNEVFDTEETRPYLVGKTLDLLLVLIALALLTLNTAVTLAVGDLPWLGRFAASLSTFAVGVVLFFAMYTLAPSRSVRWDTALIAAAFASLGFEVAKMLFGLYLANVARVDQLVSNENAIALLLFVLWIYYTSVLFLMGGEVAETYDLMRRQREQRAILA